LQPAGSAILLFGVYGFAGSVVHQQETIAYVLFLVGFGAFVIIAQCEAAHSASLEVNTKL